MRITWIAALLVLPAAFAQTAQRPAAAKASSEPFDPHDLNGVWYRTSPIQTYSNVYNVQPNLPPNLAGARGRGTVFAEAPFREEQAGLRAQGGPACVRKRSYGHLRPVGNSTQLER